jgi:hypothetical protein
MGVLISEVLLLVGLLSVLLGALWLGLWRGRRAERGDERAQAQVGAIQGAALGLLALMLGFSFAGASGRFLERQRVIVDLAAAIDTARLRADLLLAPARDEVRAALEEFQRAHLRVSARLSDGDLTGAQREAKDAERALWRVHAKVADGHDGARIMLVLDPLNRAIDLSGVRVAMARQHLPLPVLVLLVASATLAAFVLGYGGGLARHGHALISHALLLLIVLALWTTVDLDYPRMGLIRVSDAPLRGQE